jgi:hypothetical protein
MDMIPAPAGIVMEMAAIVAVPGMAAVGVPEEAVIAPIAIVEGAIETVIIAVIVITAADRDTAPIRSGACAQGQDGQDRHTCLFHCFSPLAGPSFIERAKSSFAS